MENIAKTPFPLLYLTVEENDKISAVATDLSTYIEQMEAKFITGVEPLSKWDEFVSTIESMGIKDYVKVYQTAYDRWKETRGCVTDRASRSAQLFQRVFIT